MSRSIWLLENVVDRVISRRAMGKSYFVVDKAEAVRGLCYSTFT